MFHCDSKNIYLNLMADVLYMFAILYPLLLWCADEKHKMYGLTLTLFPLVALTETLIMFATKKFKKLSIFDKIRLLSSCIVLCLVVGPIAWFTIKLGTKLDLGLTEMHEGEGIFLSILTSAVILICRLCGMLASTLYHLMSIPTKSGAEYDPKTKWAVSIIGSVVLFYLIICVMRLLKSPSIAIATFFALFVAKYSAIFLYRFKQKV